MKSDILGQINPAPPQIMWIDLNSAFATTEQQAHPSLRHRPVGIINRISPNACLITTSYEARRLGIKTGMRRQEALRICPSLVILESDPPKYNAVYHKLFNIMQSYSPICGMKSIDEGYINLYDTQYNTVDKLRKLGYEIKQRVKEEIGDYMTINVGLGTNRFLAKQAAGLHKPDGMDIITKDNILDVYNSLQLEDLTGIAKHYGRRLRSHGILTPRQFLEADEPFLRRTVFHGIVGTYWYQRLRGYEVDDYQTNLSYIGRQWAVDQDGDNDEYISSCLHYLTESVGTKMRYRDVSARGVCVCCSMNNGEYYHRKKLVEVPFNDNATLWQLASELLALRPAGRVVMLSVYVYNFSRPNDDQLSFVNEISRSRSLTNAIDKINMRFGSHAVHSAHSAAGTEHIKQKVPFGSVDYLDILLR